MNEYSIAAKTSVTARNTSRVAIPRRRCKRRWTASTGGVSTAVRNRATTSQATILATSRRRSRVASVRMTDPMVAQIVRHGTGAFGAVAGAAGSATTVGPAGTLSVARADLGPGPAAGA